MITFLSIILTLNAIATLMLFAVVGNVINRNKKYEELLKAHNTAIVEGYNKMTKVLDTLNDLESEIESEVVRRNEVN
jgi:hypothetical protein